MNINKQKGLITELECQLAFSRLGAMVCQPINEDSRYDFLVDLGDRNIIRIQCKTSSVHCEQKYIQFATRSSNSRDSKSYSKNDIDYFYTSYQHNSYLIPVEECSAEKRLWLVSPENNQTRGISFAKDYELENILLKIFQGIKLKETFAYHRKTGILINIANIAVRKFLPKQSYANSAIILLPDWLKDPLEKN